MLRVNHAAVAQYNAFLLGDKTAILIRNGEGIHHLAAYEVTLYDFGHFIGLNPHISGLKFAAVSVYVHNGLQITGTYTARQIHLYVMYALFRKDTDKFVRGLPGAGGYAAAALSDYNFHTGSPSFARISRRMALTLSLVRFP